MRDDSSPTKSQGGVFCVSPRQSVLRRWCGLDGRLERICQKFQQIIRSCEYREENSPVWERQAEHLSDFVGRAHFSGRQPGPTGVKNYPFVQKFPLAIWQRGWYVVCLPKTAKGDMQHGKTQGEEKYERDRTVVGHNGNGKPILKNVLGKPQTGSKKS